MLTRNLSTLVFAAVCSVAFGSTLSNGRLGIDARLFLDGSGVAIGQVEEGRPALLGFDSPEFVNPSIATAAVFTNGQAPTVDQFNIDPNFPDREEGRLFHATQVAGVLISNDRTDGTEDPNGDPMHIVGDAPQGVATGASLYSSGLNQTGSSFPHLDRFRLGAQTVATQNGGDVRAINLSFGVPPIREGLVLPTADGNGGLTAFVDWSAREHDTLYVVAGNQDPDPILSPSLFPTDNFNGLTVYSSQPDNNGVWRDVAGFNDYRPVADAVGVRTSPDILAPGIGYDLALPGGGERGDARGNSFSAPHVTGAAALVQQFGNIQNQANPGWGPNAARHEVTKAVLMNSADKIEDAGDGLRLGMTRTIRKSDGVSTWLDGPAAGNSAIPLDDELGVGHLNAQRAITQFASGEVEGYDGVGVQGTVPQVGWDYDNTLVEGFFQEYEFAQMLPANSYVSITLTWDREVDLVETTANGQFDAGETFSDQQFNNLDITLRQRGADIADPIVAASFSTAHNVEHLFFQIPTAGFYEFWVEEFDFVNNPGTDYAVAWWAFDGPVGIVTPGDADGNGMVDLLDYNAWVGSFGQAVAPGAGADFNGDGFIDAADYTVWRDALSSPGNSAAAPEPSCVVLLLTAVGTLRKRA